MTVKVKSKLMQPVSRLPECLTNIPSVIFTDVDDTLTHNGILPVETYSALHRLQQNGYTVIPVTGASAGWCDCLIKTWPVQYIIGENGAITMEKNSKGIVTTHFKRDPQTVTRDLDMLMQLGKKLTTLYPDIGFTQDQKFRITDVAFDIGQTVTVDDAIAEHATNWLTTQGVQARRSSIHINVWVGNHSKASSATEWLEKHNVDIKNAIFIGDSPNDESMFKQFPVSVGVANIKRFVSRLDNLPGYVTENEGGFGFVELSDVLLSL